MATSIGALSLSDFPVAAYRSVGTYWFDFPLQGGEAREYEDVTAPGTNGIEKIDHGFRGRIIGPIRICIVAASLANLSTAYQAVLSAVENKPNGITIVSPYGDTFSNCYALAGTPIPDSRPQFTGTNYMQFVTLNFTQDRE